MIWDNDLEEREILMEVEERERLIEERFDDMVYEPPMLVEVGGFTQLTRGGAHWGEDNFNQTQW